MPTSRTLQDLLDHGVTAEIPVAQRSLRPLEGPVVAVKREELVAAVREAAAAQLGKLRDIDVEVFLKSDDPKVLSAAFIAQRRALCPFLGAPSTPVTPCPDGQGFYQHFAGGSIYWHASTGAHEVHGSIRDRWAQLGWERGPIGYPIGEETPTTDGVGRFNHFQRGSIYWHPQLGAFMVMGAIRQRWFELGAEQGFLGYPVTNETPTPDTIGRFNHFQGGSIYWKPTISAHAIHGKFRDLWSSLGWEKNPGLGYPIADERSPEAAVDPSAFKPDAAERGFDARELAKQLERVPIDFDPRPDPGPEPFVRDPVEVRTIDELERMIDVKGIDRAIDVKGIDRTIELKGIDKAVELKGIDKAVQIKGIDKAVQIKGRAFAGPDAIVSFDAPVLAPTVQVRSGRVAAGPGLQPLLQRNRLDDMVVKLDPDALKGALAGLHGPNFPLPATISHNRYVDFEAGVVHLREGDDRPTIVAPASEYGLSLAQVLSLCGPLFTTATGHLGAVSVGGLRLVGVTDYMFDGAGVRNRRLRLGLDIGDNNLPGGKIVLSCDLEVGFSPLHRAVQACIVDWSATCTRNETWFRLGGTVDRLFDALLYAPWTLVEIPQSAAGRELRVLSVKVQASGAVNVYLEPALPVRATIDPSRAKIPVFNR